MWNLANVHIRILGEFFNLSELFSAEIEMPNELRLKVEANKGKSALRTNLKYNGAILQRWLINSVYYLYY